MPWERRYCEPVAALANLIEFPGASRTFDDISEMKIDNIDDSHEANHDARVTYA